MEGLLTANNRRVHQDFLVQCGSSGYKPGAGIKKESMMNTITLHDLRKLTGTPDLNYSDLPRLTDSEFENFAVYGDYHVFARTPDDNIVVKLFGYGLVEIVDVDIHDQFAVLVGYGKYFQHYINSPEWRIYETFDCEDIATINVMNEKSKDIDDSGIVVWTVGRWNAETGEYENMYAAETGATV